MRNHLLFNTALTTKGKHWDLGGHTYVGLIFVKFWETFKSRD